ncbi:MAG TPA: hypothetical protein VKR32_19810 [Puia sp.]|nr:hypothetical protein [Puia sp.]
MMKPTKALFVVAFVVAIRLPGIWPTNWSLSTKTLRASFGKLMVNPAKIEQLVASAGQDI